MDRYEILSPTQNGFRKGCGTKDCVALLSTAIQTSFEYKQQTLVGFLDITGACDQMHQAQLPLRIVRVKSASGAMCGVQGPPAAFGS
jgi:hypothetical protein